MVRSVVRNVVVFLTFMALLLACAPATASPVEPSLPYGIKRFVDVEAGVVCYSYAYNGGAGLSCLPLGHTSIDGWKE